MKYDNKANKTKLAKKSKSIPQSDIPTKVQNASQDNTTTVMTTPKKPMEKKKMLFQNCTALKPRLRAQEEKRKRMREEKMSGRKYIYSEHINRRFHLI